jgi:NADH:ubiquinone reductase (H+-translocating)
MEPKRIVVAGGGFAGLWAAVGAARKLDEMGIGGDRARVTLIERNSYHSIRVRNYEPDLADTVVPLADILEPVGIEHIQASVEGFDFAQRRVRVSKDGQPDTVPYDRLVFALGSQLPRPGIPGLAEFSFDVDTYAAACRLNAHIAALKGRPPSPGRNTALVIGSGFTGIEIATELPEKLRRALGPEETVRVVLADRGDVVGRSIGNDARPAIQQALSSLAIEQRTGVRVAEMSGEGVRLGNGAFIAAATVVWCGGMTAHPLTAAFPVERDQLDRLPVDKFMRVRGMDGVYAAGDCAWTDVEPGRPSVMSCQHGRPMGRFAGHNVVADLFGAPILPMEIDWYVTVVDLGPAGALYTAGWDRKVLTKGAAAKQTKTVINRERIYPPRSRNRAEILAAAAPVIQAPPKEVRAMQDAEIQDAEPARARAG